MAQQQGPDEREDPYLAARLKEARDWMSFRPRQAAPTEPTELTRESSVDGPLGDRQIQDTFRRGGEPSPPPPPAEEPPKRLEPHLKKMLAEVKDETHFSGGKSSLDQYQQLRKRLQG